MHLEEDQPPEAQLPLVELTGADVALALRDPAAAHQSCLGRACWDADLGRADGEPSLRVVRPGAPLQLPDSRELWSGSTESVVLGAAEDMARLLDGFSPEPLERHVSVLSREALRLYLRMSVVRVVRLVETLRRRGLETGRVLEVGSWFGSFALPLRRLGYDVVACDRYATYGHSFDGYVELMRREGVTIVVTSRESELEEIRALGTFDAVLAAAVIEHVPHTPRPLLEALFATVSPGGLLLLDTPNVARYWNRRTLERGDTIFQPIADQFSCEPPWEGHHREYTAPELAWMLDRVGCVDVEVEYLDYNMLQFEELAAEHVECLATIIEDPSQSDIILGVGARPHRREAHDGAR